MPVANNDQYGPVPLNQTLQISTSSGVLLNDGLLSGGEPRPGYTVEPIPGSATNAA